MTRTIWTGAIAALFASGFAGGAAAGDDRWTPYHEGFGGPRIRVHYVHLRIEYSPSEKQGMRQVLEVGHKVCRSGKEGKLLLGEDPGPPARPLPPEGVPEEPVVRNIEFYYTPERLLRVTTSKSFDIDTGQKLQDGTRGRNDCALYAEHGRGVMVKAGRSTCHFSLSAGRVRVRPDCNLGALIERVVTQQRGASNPNPSPENMQVPEPAEMLATGEWKTIANHRCRVYGGPEIFACIATPDERSRSMHWHSKIPGLVLEVAGVQWSEVAQTVVLDMEVSERIFEIPDPANPSPEFRRLAQ